MSKTVAATPYQLARMFHREYERLAPQFGYQTRPETAVPWETLPRANRLLMIATASSVLNTLSSYERKDGHGQ